MKDDWLKQILTTDTAWQDLAKTAILADAWKAEVFDITPENLDQVIEEKSQVLRLVCPKISEFCQNHLQIQPEAILSTLWDLWLPLGMQLAAKRQNLDRPFIQGILGGQGTGKTTISRILSLILQELGYATVSLSLDDLYKTYSDRLALVQQDPRLIWRGPPGTHDVDLGLSVLEKIRQNQTPVEIPRFDKSAYHGAGDRTTPEIITQVDIVLFEGWFVGVPPINPAAFSTPPPPIITPTDQTFARDMNQQLHNYLPLWSKLDSLIILYPTDYRCSLTWRKQAEHQMIATGKTGMSDAQIEEFVNYFWQALHPELFITPLTKSPQLVDLVIEINPNHNLGKIYKPK
ncbi:MAG TPA: glycerate kinase [Nostocaceae cyanobacterium]|nr:glycerate kinase [Nostocaceae cyanobacterium]